MEYLNKVKDLATAQLDKHVGTELEKKVKEATANVNWNSSNTLKNEIAAATFDYASCKEIMPCLWKRLEEEPRNWRIIFKALCLLEHLLRTGSDRVIDEAKDRSYNLKQMSSFHYEDETGRDKGSGIRDLSGKLVDLLNDRDQLNELRADANKHKGKFSAISNNGSLGDSSWSGADTSKIADRHMEGGGYDPWASKTDDAPKKKKKGDADKKKKKKKESSEEEEEESEEEVKKKPKKKKAVKKESSEEEESEEETKVEEKPTKGKKKGIKVEVSDKPVKKGKGKPVKLAAPGAAPLSGSDDDGDDFGSFEVGKPAGGDDWGDFGGSSTQAAPSTDDFFKSAPAASSGADLLDMFGSAPVSNKATNNKAAPVDLFFSSSTPAASSGFSDFGDSAGFGDFTSAATKPAAAPAKKAAAPVAAVAAKPKSNDAWDMLGSMDNFSLTDKQKEADKKKAAKAAALNMSVNASVMSGKGGNAFSGLGLPDHNQPQMMPQMGMGMGMNQMGGMGQAMMGNPMMGGMGMGGQQMGMGMGMNQMGGMGMGGMQGQMGGMGMGMMGGQQQQQKPKQQVNAFDAFF